MKGVSSHCRFLSESLSANVNQTLRGRFKHTFELGSPVDVLCGRHVEGREHGAREGKFEMLDCSRVVKLDGVWRQSVARRCNRILSMCANPSARSTAGRSDLYSGKFRTSPPILASWRPGEGQVK